MVIFFLKGPWLVWLQTDKEIPSPRRQAECISGHCAIQTSKHVQGQHETGIQGDGGPFGISKISRISQLPSWGLGAEGQLVEGATPELRARSSLELSRRQQCVSHGSQECVSGITERVSGEASLRLQQNHHADDDTLLGFPGKRIENKS